MYLINTLSFLWLLSFYAQAPISPPTPNLEQFAQELLEDFVKEYPSYEFARIGLSFAQNLENLPSEAQIKRQKTFLQHYALKLKKVDLKNLTPRLSVEIKHLEYQIQLLKERLKLSQEFKTALKGKEINPDRLDLNPLGKQWYQHFLKEWLSIDISPSQLKALGLRELERLQKEVKKVQEEMGFKEDEKGFYTYLKADHQYFSEPDSIQAKYQALDQQIRQSMGKLFHDTSIAEVKIQAIPNPDQDTPPGYYIPDQDCFYYKFWQGKHKKRNMPFLYIHEAIPGHHYQSQQNRKVQDMVLSQTFWYSVYAEGWAAYCEDLGFELDAYQSPEDYMGALEWNLVRAIRVVLDVGLNYEGWSEEQAREFWKSKLPYQTEIMQREIDRMLRWPVQIHTYVVGADWIRKAKKRYQSKLGTRFDPRDFHQKLLESGPLPLEVLEYKIFDK